MHIWISISYNDLTATSLELRLMRGNYPKIAELFRVGNSYNLPR